MTRVPLAPPVVRGLINLRGQIVTSIDLRRRLGMKNRADDLPPVNVVVQTSDGAVSLLVDEIGDVLDVPQRKIETPPATIRGESRALLIGVHQRADKLLQILNVDEVVNLALASNETVCTLQPEE
jgi:purine-binding chemotaxis protein CheW